nr:NAD-dependent epimerase/dehydratase family protein [Polymorphobacter sp.]
MSKGVVLVTGASGYIAGFAIKQLLSEGWTVRGTIRSLARAEDVRTTLSAPHLQLFAADLTNDAGWAQAAAGADFMLHIASPIPLAEPKNPDDLIIPARDGALRALRAARDAGLKRVVMTSSTAAICYGSNRGNDKVFTEADWSNLDSPDSYAYIQSKTVAERAARDFIAREGGALEFCTINPSAVLGPVLGKDFSASLQVVKKLMDGALPGLPRLGFPIVDARDIADLHIRAMVAPNMHGERFLGSGEFLWLKDIAEILKFRLGAQAKRVPTRALPDFLLKAAALFDPTVRMVVPELGRARRCDASHAKTVLGWQTRPASESITDCAQSLLAAGLIKP